MNYKYQYQTRVKNIKKIEKLNQNKGDTIEKIERVGRFINIYLSNKIGR